MNDSATGLTPAASKAYRSELSVGNRAMRALWGLSWAVFCRVSPRPFQGWRRFWLRLFGAKIATGASVYPSARIFAPWQLEMGRHSAIGDYVDCYNVDRIVLGDGAIVSQHAHLCTASHDIADPGRRLVTAPIVLGAEAWVCAGAYVHLGVTLGEGAVAGAHAVVMKDVPAWTVVAGNPARIIKQRAMTERRAPG
jgi:putative colanic acid biosynthesis acetyltransferase WcaF